MNQLFKNTCFAISIACFAASAEAQTRQGNPSATPAGTPPPASPAPARSVPKPYKDVITDKAVTTKGMFTVHRVEDKYYLELPVKLLERDILVLNRVSKSSVDVTKAFNGYAGDQIGDNVIRFEKGPSNKIFLKNISYKVNPDSTKEMYRSVLNSNIQPIALSFDVKAYAPDSLGRGIVIEITDQILADNEIFGFGQGAKPSFQAGAFQADKSYILSVKPYPTNVEVKTVKTFLRAATPAMPGMPQANPSQATITLEMNSSMVLLPEVPMRPRFADRRVGYFSNGYTDFDANQQGVKNIDMITRWRLEPKPEDMEKYKRGELVEPIKPIVYYIDPTTPKKWVPYLIQGINDWQVAFEKAGFKNAIMGKEAPTWEQDSTWSLEDARNSAIIYKPSAVQNAYGPSTTDPR
ncbi:MAG: DUF5117 domain-containing protein, partial [Chitinophagaceae bacterium]